MNEYSTYPSINPEDVIDFNPPTFDASKLVVEAIARMNKNSDRGNRRYSYILIVKQSKLVGILTERDIVRLTAAGVELAKTKIAEVMTTQLITLKKSDLSDINLMMTTMRQNKIRHLPIVDDEGELEGLVSVKTIIQALHPSNLLKFRRVAEAMTNEVAEAPTTASVLDLSKIMAQNKTSCVVIVNYQKPNSLQSSDNNCGELSSIPVGIITERDIVQFQMLGLDLAKTIAETVMSTPLICLKTTDSLMQVRQQMEKLRVRRLVIVGDEGKLKGMVTQFNMLKVLDPVELFGVIETLQSELEIKTSQLLEEKELAQITLQSIGDAVITTNAEGRVVNFNPIAEQLTGWKAAEAKHQPLVDVFKIVNEHTREPVPNPVLRVLSENKTFELADRTILIARDGTEYAIEDSAAPIRDRQGGLIGAVIVFRDVTESRHLSNQLSWQASHDALTGLYNRREFEKRLLVAISSAQNEEHEHTLCYLDLDRFKIINDTCGHGAGDKLLKQITNLLLQQVRSTDILARLGGDEFGLLLNQCSLATASRIASNFRQKVEDFRFDWQGRTFSVGVSIGLVKITGSTESLNRLINTADAACYIAKANGRNCLHVHEYNDIELTKNLGERKWIVRLNQALANNEFCLYSQKIVAVDNNLNQGKQHGKVNRYEILLRLQDRQGKLILPGVFLPAAERYDLMPIVDRWVIDRFMTAYSSCSQTSKDNNIYAINLSGASINSQSFRVFLKEQFDRFHISPHTICFEITETVAISNLAIAAKFIRELKQLGCSIALDDFGSGMSSLAYLKNLSIDYLKIDGSFVKNIVRDKADRMTVEYFNQIAQLMNIKTVAEFVEDDAIFQQLQNIGVNYAQGFGIAKPAPLIFN